MLKQVVVGLVLLSAVVGGADELVFKSGARLTGKVEKIEGGAITFVSDDVGKVSAKAEKVALMITEKANTVQFLDRSTTEAVVCMTNGAYTASGKPLDMANVKAVNPAVETWHGSVNFSGAAARGNTVSEKVAILGELNRRWEHDRFTANGGYYFAQSGRDKDTKTKDEDRILLSAQEDHFWWNKVYSYVNGKFERDRLNFMDHRYRIGGGLGYQWLDGQVFEATGKWSFNQEVGFEYVKERWSHKEDDADENYAAFRYAHHLKWAPKWSDKVSVFHNFEYHPDMDEWQDVYIFNSDIGATVDLWAGWNFLAKFEWDYNSSPADTAQRSDMRYLAGLGYKW